MKSILQFSTDDISYNDFGIVRTAKGQDYTLTGLYSTDRIGTRDFVGSRSNVVSHALIIPQTFLDFDKYFFRLIYPNDPSTIFNLGEHDYMFSFDGNHDLNKVFSYRVTLNFTSTLTRPPIVPPEPKDVGRLTMIRQYGAPGRAYLVHFDPNPPAALFDSIENLSFNSVYKAFV